MSKNKFNGLALLFLSEISGTRASCFRQEKIIITYLKLGITTVVIDNSFLTAKIYTFNNLIQFNNFRSEIRNLKQSPPSIREGIFVNILRKIKHYLFIDVISPFQWVSFILTFLKLLKYKNTHCNYSVGSSPSISCLIWAKLFGIIFNANKTIIDFRDEWAYHPWLPNLHNKTKNKIEKWLVTNTSTASVSKFISDNLKLRTGKDVFTVYNGPDVNFVKAFQTSEENSKIIRVVYTGSIPQGSVNVEGLKNIILNVINQYSYISFTFIGACNSLQEILPAFPGKIYFLPHLPLKDVRNLQSNADVLLFLGANFPLNGGIVSAKIFEYLQSGKKILPLFIYPSSDINYIINSSCGFCPELFTSDQVIELLKNGTLNLPKLTNNKFIDSLNENIEFYFTNAYIN